MKIIANYLAIVISTCTLHATSWYGELTLPAYDSNWNYSQRFEWLYFANGVDDPAFVYTPKVGWLYSTEDYYPFVYSFDQESWLYFYDYPKPGGWRHTIAYNFRNNQWQNNGQFAGYPNGYIRPEEYWALFSNEITRSLEPVYYYGPKDEYFTFRTKPVINDREMNLRLVISFEYNKRYSDKSTNPDDINKVRIRLTPRLVQYSELDYSKVVSTTQSYRSSHPYYCYYIERDYTNYNEYTEKLFMQFGNKNSIVQISIVDFYSDIINRMQNRLELYYVDPTARPTDASTQFLVGEGKFESKLYEPWGVDPDSPPNRYSEAMLFALSYDREHGGTTARDEVRAQFMLMPDTQVQPNHLLYLKEYDYYWDLP